MMMSVPPVTWPLEFTPVPVMSSEAIVFVPTRVMVPPLFWTRLVFVAICWAEVSVRFE